MAPDDFLSDFLSFGGVTRNGDGSFSLQGTFRPVALVATVLSAAVLAVFNGIINIVRGVFGLVITPLRAVQSFAAELIIVAVGPNGLIATAVTATQGQLLASGVIGFALATSVVALTLYVLSAGVSLLE